MSESTQYLNAWVKRKKNEFYNPFSFLELALFYYDLGFLTTLLINCSEPFSILQKRPLKILGAMHFSADLPSFGTSLNTS